MRTVEEIKDDIDSIARKRDTALLEMNDYQKKLEELSNEYYEADSSYVKVQCLTCGGVGYIPSEDGSKKVVCKNEALPMLSCNGKGYIWMKKWKQV